jgi:predicted PurR-regulated permease PerM
MRGTRSNPWRRLTDARVTYALKILMVIVLALYTGQFVIEILGHIRVAVYILIVSVLLAYLIYPAVQRLARRMPLALAIVLVYAVILIAIIVAAFAIVPRITNDTAMLVRHYPDFVARLDSLVYDPNDPVTSRLPHWVQDEIASTPADLATWLRTRGVETFSHVILVLAGTAAALALFIVVPVVTAYLLLDLDHLKRILSSIVPEQRWRPTVALLSEIDGVIGGFIRGQLFVALTVGVLITIALVLLRVPYPYLFGLLAAIGDLIPYVGAVLAFLPAFLSAALTNGWLNALFVTIAFVAIYEAEGHFIAPTVVGRQVRLSAFLVMLSLLIGAELGGLFGMLVAVPIAGVLRVIAARVLAAAKSKAST